MTNPYYNYTSNIPVTQSRAASSQIRNEYAAIGNGFDATYAAINLLAPLASPTFTGVVTVPTPTTATAAATKAYVDALSVAAGNVPPGGAAGQALIKNSSTNYDMSWGQASPGMGGTTATGNVTLTASSPAAMTITPASPGLYVTLPDATTCTKADNLFAVYNAGDYDYGVKDSTGTQLGWVRARTGAMIGLSDSSTAAGIWATYGLEKTGITASYVNSTLANMGSTIRCIALDANRTCFLFGGTDCYAIVYDASTQTWGSATLVRATVASGAFIGVLAATDKVLVCSCNSTTAFEAVTLTIATNTVTVNTGTKATATLSGNWSTFGQLIAVSTSWVLSYGYATASAIRALTVSGTTPTIGLQSMLTPAVSVSANLYAAGSIVRTVVSDSSAVYAKPYTVSGSTLSAGTQATATTTAAPFRAFLNGNGNIVCHYINTTHYATIFKLTGTTEAASSVSLGTAPSSILTNSDYSVISASKTFFASNSGAGSTASFNILTDSAGAATAGTPYTISYSGTPTTAMCFPTIGTTARAGFQSVGTDVYQFECSGASPSAISVLPRSAVAGDYYAPTDAYGVRSGAVLIAGTSCQLPFGSSTATGTSIVTSGGSYVAAAYWRRSQGTLFAGGSANESIFVYAAGVFSSGGILIQRIEAAA